MRRIETDAAFKLYPALHYKFRPNQIRAAFTVSLATNFGSIHELLIVAPRWYPIRPPALYLLTRIRGPYSIEHIYLDDGRLCVFEKLERDWNPEGCDLVTAVEWGAIWLFCQEFFQKYGRWPARQSHRPRPRPRGHPWDARKRK